MEEESGTVEPEKAMEESADVIDEIVEELEEPPKKKSGKKKKWGYPNLLIFLFFLILLEKSMVIKIVKKLKYHDPLSNG